MTRSPRVFAYAFLFVVSIAVSASADDGPAPPVDPKLITNFIDMKLALIPAGTFQMGSDDPSRMPDRRRRARREVPVPSDG